MTKITLKEVLDISEASKLRKSLMQKISKDENISVNAEKVGKITSPIIQLLLVCNADILEKGKKMYIENPSDIFISSIKGIGVENIFQIK